MPRWSLPRRASVAFAAAAVGAFLFGSLFLFADMLGDAQAAETGMFSGSDVGILLVPIGAFLGGAFVLATFREPSAWASTALALPATVPLCYALAWPGEHEGALLLGAAWFGVPYPWGPMILGAAVLTAAAAVLVSPSRAQPR